MKKVFALFFTLTFVLSISTFAQGPSVTIGSETGASPVDVPVTFELAGQTLKSFDLTVAYNPLVISSVAFQASPVVTFTNVPTFSYPAAGQFKVSWSNVSDQSITNNGTLFYLKLFGSVGTSDLDFTSSNVSGENELLTFGAAIITSTFVDGDVTFTAPVPLSNWAIFIGLGLIIAFLVVRFRRIV